MFPNKGLFALPRMDMESAMRNAMGNALTSVRLVILESLSLEGCVVWVQAHG